MSSAMGSHCAEFHVLGVGYFVFRPEGVDRGAYAVPLQGISGSVAQACAELERLGRSIGSVRSRYLERHPNV